jgi:hypothetical protein
MGLPIIAAGTFLAALILVNHVIVQIHRQNAEERAVLVEALASKGR